jgi:hypothetical protein
MRAADHSAKGGLELGWSLTPPGASGTTLAGRMSSGSITIDVLPDDILVEIFSWLHLPDILQLGEVNKRVSRPIPFVNVPLADNSFNDTDACTQPSFITPLDSPLGYHLGNTT